MDYLQFQKKKNSDLTHHGVLGMRWGVRRYQNADGTLTEKGKARKNKLQSKYNKLHNIYIDKNEKYEYAVNSRSKKRIKNAEVNKRQAEYKIRKLEKRLANLEGKAYNKSIDKISPKIKDFGKKVVKNTLFIAASIPIGLVGAVFTGGAINAAQIYGAMSSDAIGNLMLKVGGKSMLEVAIEGGAAALDDMFRHL